MNFNRTSSSLILMVIFFVLIYFLMIRPQKKKEKAEAEMRAGLKVGDDVLTIGGVKGKVVKVTETTVVIATGSDRTKIEFVKSAIGSVQAGDSKAAEKTEKKADDVAEEKIPDRTKKVTPKKLSKADKAEESTDAE